jgi:bifunctional UDP-N-acetylglucosamine pyrophosphorylase / glucosamine-1-phosphate N-acetyltransferase
VARRRPRAAVILAAGEGKRLKSSRPKVLHRAAGRPLLGHVVAALRPLDLADIVVVASPRVEEVKADLEAAGLAEGLSFAIQPRPLGTGDAASAGLASLGDFDGTVIVTPGDSPLLSSDTLSRLLELRESSGAPAAVLTASLDDPSGYGRVVRGNGSVIERIVEERDASPEERDIREINASVYAFDSSALSEALREVSDDNAQNEIYLTDVVQILRSHGGEVLALETDPLEIVGVNDRAQLAEAARLLRERTCRRWLDAGVSIVDPSTTYIDASVEIEPDATILPFTFLEGRTVVRSGAEVGPQSRIVDSEIGPGAIVTFAVVRDSRLGEGSSVGPFASIRPGTTLGPGARLGTFVESKNTSLGRDSKANHLAYLGDADIGSGVNVGAGTITCNWDGVDKNKTVIDDDAYISSDTMLVAPVRIGKRAATGAGAVVRDDVPDDALAVGMPARILEGKGDRMKKRGGAPGGDPSDGPE